MWWVAPIILGGLAGVRILKRRRRDQENSPLQRSELDGAAAYAPPDLFGYYLPRWIDLASPDISSEDPQPVMARTTERAAPTLLTPSRVTVATVLACLGLLFMNAQSPHWGVALSIEMFMGALIGIGTNWIAIKMLFRPKERTLGFQGVIPANRAKLINEMSEGVAKNLLDAETIRKAVHESDLVTNGVADFIAGLKRVLESPSFQQDVANVLAAYTVSYFRNPKFRAQVTARLSELASLLPTQLRVWFAEPMGKFLRGQVDKHSEDLMLYFEREVLDSIRTGSQGIVDFLRGLPEGVEAQRAEIERAISEAVADRISNIDIAAIIRGKLETFDEDRLEDLILSATDTHLAKIQYFGWLLGFVIGAVPSGFEALARSI